MTYIGRPHLYLKDSDNTFAKFAEEIYEEVERDVGTNNVIGVIMKLWEQQNL